MGPRPRRQGPRARSTGRPPQQYENSGPRPSSGPALTLRNPVFATERELLKLALQRPELVSPAFDAYGVDEFTAPPYAAVRQAIMEAGGAEYGVQDPQEYLVRVREAAPDDAVRAMVTELAVEAIMRKTVDENYAGEQLVTVRRRAVERRIRDVQGTLARAQRPGRPGPAGRRTERVVGAPAVRPGPAREGRRRALRRVRNRPPARTRSLLVPSRARADSVA